MSNERQAFEKAIETALASAGYTKVKRGKFAKKIGRETEIFVYPQARSRGSSLELQPIVGFENATLRSRLSARGPDDEDFRVCHVYLAALRGVAELRNGNFILWIPKTQPTTRLVDLFMVALEGIAIKKFLSYDSVEQVKNLIKLYIEAPDKADVIIMDAREKRRL